MLMIVEMMYHAFSILFMRTLFTRRTLERPFHPSRPDEMGRVWPDAAREWGNETLPGRVHESHINGHSSLLQYARSDVGFRDASRREVSVRFSRRLDEH